MKIGITYDLKDDYASSGLPAEVLAEFDSEDTINAIAGELRGLSHTAERIGNLFALTGRLTHGDRWDLVFNIAEGLNGFGREAHIPALLDAYRIPYTFSDPLTLAITLHKAMAKRVVRDLGIPTAEFATVNTRQDVDAVELGWPLFAKPVAGGSSMGISAASKVRSRVELRQVCEDLWARFRQPVLVERFLTGREFTVGIAGTGDDARVLAVMEILLSDEAEPEIYSYANKQNYRGRVRYRLVEEATASEIALRAWRGLECRDAGRIDLRSDENGRMQFLEANPLPGLNPQDSDLPIMMRLKGLEYRALIQMIVESACARIERMTSCCDS